MDTEDKDNSPTGPIHNWETGRILHSPTGKFRRSNKYPRNQNEDLDSPTQKIIIFPLDKVKENPPPPPPSNRVTPPPIVFTAPLPKIQDLPPDFFEEGELDEHYNPQTQSPDFSSQLDQEDWQMDYSDVEGKIAGYMKDLEQKATAFQQNMFREEEGTDWAAIERAERLIPGTDHEDGKRVAPPSREKVKVPKIRKAPPDMPPHVLQQQLAKRLPLLSVRRYFILLLLLGACAVTFFSLEETVEALATYESRIVFLGVVLAIAMVSLVDILGKGLLHCFAMGAGMDTLAFFSGIFCGLDCLLQSSLPEPRGQYPYVALVLMQYYFLLYGEEKKCLSNIASCKVASKGRDPFLLRLEPHKWNNRSCYNKAPAPLEGFSSQLMDRDGAQIAFAFTTPIFLIMAFVMAMNLTRDTTDFVWAFSAFLVVSAPFGATVLYGRPLFKVTDRLKKDMFSTLAGWTGVAPKGKHCIIQDLDLFPEGDVSITGSRLYNNFSEKKVLAFTTALLEEGDVGCVHLFHSIMDARGQKTPPCRDAMYHDAGGITAQIGKDQVMIGCAAFTEFMNIPVPEGCYWNHAIYCCINNRLAGFYSLEYRLHDMVSHSLSSLQLERIRPVLATRDFAHTPEVLRRRYDLKTIRMDFPPITRRRELSDEKRIKGGDLTAVILMDGIEPMTDCVIAATRLRKSVYQSLGTVIASACLGFFLVAYLVASTAYNALSPDNLMIFLLLWLAPVWIISDMAHRY